MGNESGSHPTPEGAHTFSRRALIKGALGLAGAAALGAEARPQLALAGTGETAPWIPKDRAPEVQPIATASFDVDPALHDRQITPIQFMMYNQYQDEFRNSPDNIPGNPRDRLDMAFLKFSAALHHNAKDFTSLPDRALNPEEMTTSAFKKREDDNFTIPSEGKLSTFLPLVKDDKGKIKLWVSDDNAADPEFGLSLKEYDSRKGIDVVLTAEQPKNVIQVDHDNGPVEIYSGYTAKINDGQLQIALYHKDTDYQDMPIYTTGKNLDLSNTRLLYFAMESLMMFGGRTDAYNVINEPYNDERAAHNFALYPDIATLLLGPLSTKTVPGVSYEGFYDTAPVLEVVSPNVPRKEGER